MEELFACLVWLFVDVLLIRTGRVVVVVGSFLEHTRRAAGMWAALER